MKSPTKKGPAPSLTKPDPTATTITMISGASDIPLQLRRRRDASRRLPVLVCGHRDTLDCTTAAVPAVVVEPDTRHAVLALATRHRFARWEVETLVGDLSATELITFGGAR